MTSNIQKVLKIKPREFKWNGFRTYGLIEASRARMKNELSGSGKKQKVN